MEYNTISFEAQQIWLQVENTEKIRTKVSNLIWCLVRKSIKGKDLNKEKLAKSSILEQICSEGVKEERKNGNTEIKTIHRTEFKNAYAEHILEEVESEVLNQVD